MGESIHTDDSTVEAYRDQLRGGLLQPGDDGYDDARSVWNGMIDAEPALVARCAGTADVIASVEFARERELPLAVKAGGHNVAGRAVCDDGLVVDLTPMDSVRIDPHERTATVGPGASWADFDHEAQAFGLATTGGVVSTTGVAGLTLGGGIGYLARKHGLAADNLLAADVVTADGDLVRASESENEALLWGLRGGGGNFGIVTAMEFELHEVGPTVLAGPIFHPIEATRDCLEQYREVTADAPDELACYAFLVHIPPEPPFPEHLQGEPSFAFVCCYAGPIEAGERVLEPIRSVGDPIADAIEPMPYTALQGSLDDGAPKGERYYWKSHYIDEITDGAIDAVVEHGSALPGPFTIVAFEPMGGAVGRIPVDATAYPHRDAAYNFGIFTGWSDPARDDDMTDWTREFHEAMAPYATGGRYANYLDRDEDDRVEAAFGENLDRLADLKSEYDPENLFSQAQDVRPGE